MVEEVPQTALDVQQLAAVLLAFRKGDFTVRMSPAKDGDPSRIASTLNDVLELSSQLSRELERISHAVGKQGDARQRASIGPVWGSWRTSVECINDLIDDLLQPSKEVARVIGAVARGDLSQTVAADVDGRPLQGEFQHMARVVNTMVDQLDRFSNEVTRVAREVGTEGRLGGQADVRGVSGVWRDLTDSVNSMAGNLTSQVRNIAEVTTAVARGDLSRKITVDVHGEILELKNTINTMVDQLNSFASEVTRVAREVGTEGKLGGQAEVLGAAGVWRDLTNNVNQLAANLTTQVRAIADVATAVTKGDLSRTIAVEALGEVAALKDTINQMIGNLAETTRKNSEQDWLKTNLAKFTRMMQGQRDLQTVAKLLLSQMTPLVSAQQGVFYINEADTHSPAEDHIQLRLLCGYAYRERKSASTVIRAGEGLVGQCALERERILVTNVPAGYTVIGSGLGEAAPRSIVVLPVLFEGEVKAVIELASFNPFSAIHLQFLDQLTDSIGIVLNTIAATMSTEQFLQQSQALAAELQFRQEELTGSNQRLEQQARTLQASEELLKSQQEQLQRTNDELQDKARLLADQKNEVEGKNFEVEQAKQALEDKAEQLSQISRYKSEFLANMSHELRTPLNNLLILARMLSDNSENNLTSRQVKFADTIHQSGTELLGLINDILDLSKIEAGKMDVEITPVRFTDLGEYVSRNFRHVAEQKGLGFHVALEAGTVDRVYTDQKRLQQVLKNLLANALKFTERGSVTLRVAQAKEGWRPTHPILSQAASVVAFSVEDTGIGIASDKQKLIFEAFQQADGTTSRKYGGTGLGLSISRELARLLGGQIRLSSEAGRGSTFTLFLPQTYVAPAEEEVITLVAQPAPVRPVAPKVDPEEPSLARASLATAASVRTQPETSQPDGETEVAEANDYVEDDRATIQPDDTVLLIVEDDPTFARIVVSQAREMGLKALVATRGDTALALARDYRPKAITLDITLPDVAGWNILDRLKHDPATRHIPVHIISGTEDRRRSLGLGALTHLTKSDSGERTLSDALAAIRESVDRQQRCLLLVMPAGSARDSIVALLRGEGLDILLATDVEEALSHAQDKRVDCLVVDTGLPDDLALRVIEAVQRQAGPQAIATILYGNASLSPQHEAEMRRIAQTALVRYVKSPQCLLGETVLLLHRDEAELSDDQRQALTQANMSDAAIANSKVLIVDDDLRNIFALTSVLERHNLRTLHAENGRTALQVLQANPDVDMVLMDIMMPEMDGYETTRAIRQIPQFQQLPIIALTAKAMKGDREKCLQAGATDYVTKPVDLEQLFSALRVWLFRSVEAPTC